MIIESEREQLSTQVHKGTDRVAFIPTNVTDISNDKAKINCYKQFCEKADLWLGAKVEIIDDAIAVEDAVLYTDKEGLKSVWASCDNKNHKLAYQTFWWKHGGVRELEWLPGKIVHVDHSFNKARLLAFAQPKEGNCYDPDESEPIDSKQMPDRIGYIRLFAVPAVINTTWGRLVEGPLSALGETGGLFRAASWLILAKLTGLMPPRSMEDALIGAERLEAQFGKCGFNNRKSIARDYFFQTRIMDGVSIIGAPSYMGMNNALVKLTTNDSISDKIWLIKSILSTGYEFPLEPFSIDGWIW